MEEEQNINWLDKEVSKHYLDGVKYQNSMKFTEKWPEFERFLAGDQWPEPTGKTANLPRPVFNIIRYIQTHKKASVMNENIKMVFSSEEIARQEELIEMPEIDNAMGGADKFTKFSEATWERLQQDKLNDELLGSASNCGTGILHYYWNDKLTGGITTKYSGDFEGEFLDPSNVFFGDPQCKNVQKQPYIIITSRERVASIKEIAKNSGMPEHILSLITADKDTKGEIYDSAKHEIESNEKVTVLTKYYKENDTVWFKKVVNDVCFVQPINTELSLYPIVLLSWLDRKKCIYGIGDTEGLIANQKAINFLLAMMLLSTQQTAWPKLIQKPGALKQAITNAPGEVLTDHYIGQGDGIKYLQAGAFNPMALTLVDKFVEITKNFSGANDAAVGEAPGADMAAQAIMLLQRSAGMPLEDIKKRYYRAMEDVGRVWEDLWKTKYNLTRSIKVKDSMGNEIMDSMTGTDYQDVPMNLKIDIGPASTYSEYMAQTTLDKLYDNGAIDTIMYLKYSAPSSVPFRDRLIAELERNMQNAINQPMPMDMEGDMGNPMPQGGNPNEVIQPGMNGLGIPGVKEPNVGGVNNGKM